MDKRQLIQLLKTITPLYDELDIIYQFYKDEYLYGVFCEGSNSTAGIYDCSLDLSTSELKCFTKHFYIKKVQLILNSPYPTNNNLKFKLLNDQTHDVYWDIYDEKNNRWFILSYNQLYKGIYDPGIIVVDKLPPSFRNSLTINTIF